VARRLANTIIIFFTTTSNRLSDRTARKNFTAVRYGEAMF